MTYPLSNSVSVGDATEAAQYNHLRLDAVYLGNDAASSGTVRDLLMQAIGEIHLTRVNSVTISLSASAGAPCALMIEGCISTVTDTVTLTLSADALPEGGRYWIYAVGAAGTFTLAAGAAAPNHSRVIGTFLWTGSGIIPGTLKTLAAYQQEQNSQVPAAANGRLSLAAGDPVPETDIVQSDTLYYLPYQGNRIGLYLYGGWEYFSFSGLQLGKTGLIRCVPYDVFLGAAASGLELTAAAWSGAAVRPPGALQRVDGVRVSGSDPGKRYLGTVVLNESGYFEDSRTGRLVWNENNRLARPLLSVLASSSENGTNHEGVWAPYYDDDAPSLRVLIPGSDTEFSLDGVGMSSAVSTADTGYGRAAAVGICQDMTAEAPYSGNSSIVPVFLHTQANAPELVRLNNYGAVMQGYHRYTLAFWTNYTCYPIKKPAGTLGTPDGAPGLYGKIIG